MTYIYSTKTAKPINDKTYADAAEATAAFRAPAWAGAPETEMDFVSDGTFKSRGVTYQIIEGENPTKAIAAAKRVIPQRAPELATKAQRRYLDILGGKVPSSAWDHWVKPGMTKDQASRAISALKDIATN